MAYMDLMRGLLSGERVQYPIFEMELLSSFTTGLVSWSGSTWQPFLSVSFTNNADISAAFPNGIPTTVESDGVVCQNDFKYVPGSPAWTPKTQAFSALAPTATPPEDWSTNFFDYYTASTRTVGGNTFAVFRNVAAETLTYQNSPPTWNPNTSYYHDDLPLKQRAAHIFTTDEGWTFGVNISPNWQYSYIRAVANCNPEHALVSTGDVFAIHDPIGQQYGGYIPTDTLATYQLQSGFTSSIPFLQIFVHCSYDDVDYYGIAQILMSGTSSTAHPIGIRLLAFPTDCYGDSIKGGDVPESGKWGPDSTSGGGNGTFEVTQDDLTPSDVSIAVRRDRFNEAFNNGGTNVYQILTSDFGTIASILYGEDFWDRYKNSMFNPLSAIIACHLLPSNLLGPVLTGRDKHLTLAGYDVSAQMETPINFPIISSMQRYLVGSFDFNNPRYSDSFADFAPNTIAILHLPYIGECEIDINAFMYGTLILEYICDNVSGNCAAWVWNKDRNGHGRLKYVFTGNCASNIPLYSMSQDGSAVGRVAAQAIIGIGSIALGAGLTAATGGTGAGVLALGGVAKRIGARTLASAAAGGLALGANKAVTDGLSTSQHLQSTGGVSGNAGALGHFDAWLEIIRPVWSNPSDYQTLNGIPSNTSTKLSECTGFTQITSIEFVGCTATAEEIEELKSILESGIRIRNLE